MFGWIPNHFPQMPIGIAEVARIAAVERLLRLLDDLGAGAAGLRHHCVDLLAAGDIVADGERRGADRRLGKAGVVRDVVLRPDSELHPAGQLEERHGAVLELAADYTFGRQPEAVAIEGQRPLEIGDAEGEDGNAGHHRDLLRRNSQAETLSTNAKRERWFARGWRGRRYMRSPGSWLACLIQRASCASSISSSSWIWK